MPVANPQHIFTLVNFPSGHTSWSFAGLGFLSLYLSSKVKAFNREGHVAMLCIVFAPLLAIAMVGNKMYAFGGELKPNFHIDRDLYFFDFETHRWSLAACLMGISRVDDYWHHWQDGFAGALIGLFVAAFCYSQFYPNPYHEEGWGPR